jgi:hypothetical protein
VYGIGNENNAEQKDSNLFTKAYKLLLTAVSDFLE